MKQRQTICGTERSSIQKGISEVKNNIKISPRKGHSQKEAAILLCCIPMAFKIDIRILSKRNTRVYLLWSLIFSGGNRGSERRRTLLKIKQLIKLESFDSFLFL